MCYQVPRSEENLLQSATLSQPLHNFPGISSDAIHSSNSTPCYCGITMLASYSMQSQCISIYTVKLIILGSWYSQPGTVVNTDYARMFSFLALSSTAVLVTYVDVITVYAEGQKN